MLGASSSKCVLVIDPDLGFLNQIQKNHPDKDLKTLTVNSSSDAQKIIIDPKNELMALFVNPVVDQPLGISLIRACRAQRPGIPIYTLYDNQMPFSEKESRLLGINGSLSKPLLNFTGMREHIVKNSLPNAIGSALPPLPSKPLEQIQNKAESRDSQFIPIPSNSFLAGNPSIFDLYIRLSANKYVKALMANQPFDIQQLQNYLKNGITHFYLSKTSHAKYLAACNQLANLILRDSRFSPRSKLSLAATQGEATFKFLELHGIDMKAIQFATEFIKNIELLLNNSEITKNESVQKLLKDISKSEHSVSISIIACLLASELGFGKDRSVATVGLASFLHDIGLLELSSDIYDQEDNESLLTIKQLSEFQSHPTLSAKILSGFSRIDPIVIQAVEQHHERRTGKGFPNRLGPGQISRIAEIVGISDEFARLIRRTTEEPFLNVFWVMEESIFNGFSSEITQAFQKIFFPQTKK